MYPKTPSSRSAGSPSSSTRPLVGSTRPARMLNSVDLPHPDGPTIETNSPSLASMSIASSARTSPLPVPLPRKTLEMLSVWSLACTRPTRASLALRQELVRRGFLRGNGFLDQSVLDEERRELREIAEIHLSVPRRPVLEERQDRLERSLRRSRFHSLVQPEERVHGCGRVLERVLVAMNGRVREGADQVRVLSDTGLGRVEQEARVPGPAEPVDPHEAEMRTTLDIRLDCVRPVPGKRVDLAGDEVLGKVEPRRDELHLARIAPGVSHHGHEER